MENKNEIINYCKNNKTSQRDLMKLFGFKHRPAVTKFLQENNITIIPFTEEDRRQRISDARENKRLEL
jgi:intein-encoded DNA endonuclease-like protein